MHSVGLELTKLTGLEDNLITPPGRPAPCEVPDIILQIVYKKIHSSCEIEDFVENHLCKMCDTAVLRSRVLRVVCPH